MKLHQNYEQSESRKNKNFDEGKIQYLKSHIDILFPSLDQFDIEWPLSQAEEFSPILDEFERSFRFLEE